MIQGGEICPVTTADLRWLNEVLPDGASAKISTACAVFRVQFWYIEEVVVGDVVQLVRMLPCHGRGRGFEPRRPRHTKQIT